MSVRLLHSGHLQYLVLWQEGLSTHRPADGQVSKHNPSLRLHRLTDASSQFVPLLLCCRIVKQEVSHTQRESPKRAERHRTNGLAEPRPVDILELLSKAKEEYQRVRKAHTGHTDAHTHTLGSYQQRLIDKYEQKSITYSITLFNNWVVHVWDDVGPPTRVVSALRGCV